MTIMLEGEVPSLTIFQVGGAGATGMSVPAGYAITGIYLQETSGNPITGGLNIGTSTGAADVVSAFAVPGGSFNAVPAAGILRLAFSASAAQPLFISAVTSWNSALLNIVVRLARGIPMG
jgi:hypothetical protein